MKRLIAFFFTALFISCLPITPVIAQDKTEQAATPDKHPVIVQYKNGLLNMNCSAVPLGKILQSIGDKTAAKFVLTDPDIKKTPVTLSLQQVSFDNALKRILRGYSYSSRFENDVEIVTVFPSQTGKKKTRQPAAASAQPSQKQKVAIRPDTYIAPDTTIEVDDLGTDEPVPAETVVETDETPVPPEKLAEGGTEPKEDLADTDTEIRQEDEFMSLDEYMPIELPPIQPTSYNQTGDPAGDIGEQYRQRAAAEQELRLKRSLEVLASNHTNLYGDALNEVVGIDSPQATAALLQAATTENEKSDNRMNIVAAEGLWHHAADLGFNDPASVAALQQMAQADDPAVRKIGRQALRDMERYKARQQ